MSEQQSPSFVPSDVSQIGHRLFTLRTALGLSQQQLADALNIPVTDMRSVEDGVFNTDVEILMRLASEFPQVSLHWLLIGRGHWNSVRNEGREDGLMSAGAGVSITVTGGTVNVFHRQPGQEIEA